MGVLPVFTISDHAPARLITVYIIGVSTPILLLGGFFFVLLRAVAEGLYVLLDIQENTKSKS